MNFAQWSMTRKTVTFFFCVLIVVAGIASYATMGKLEDPEFTVKTAVIATSYPGATAQEVREEVTERISEALQTMEQVKDIRSRNSDGLSVIYVDMKDHYKGRYLPEIWDILRQKVSDLQPFLPPGTHSMVNNDFGDVYGQYYALRGDGYTMKELKDYADLLKRELVMVPGVASVAIVGDEKEGVFVEFNPQQLASMKMPPEALFGLLHQQNTVTSAGQIRIDSQMAPLFPSSGISTIEDLRHLVVGGAGAGLTRLSDIATIRRGPIRPPQFVLLFNDQKAIGIGISTDKGGNVIAMSQGVRAALERLRTMTPVGMELHEIYVQSDQVNRSIDDFVTNLAEALIIVIGVLLLFMGLRTGLLIGVVLLLVIAATFATMKLLDIPLQIVSLGSLIIALGMLVDNAIVVSEGMLVGLERHENLLSAASRTVKNAVWPLLGGTLIAILAFSPIGLAPDQAGEFCISIFQVVGISLMWSWLLALTATPALASVMLKTPKNQIDPYDRPLFRAYRRLLEGSLRHRWLTLVLVISAFLLSLFCFDGVKRSFFPEARSPYFTIDLWSPQGTSIEAHQLATQQLSHWLLKRDDVKNVTASVGSGSLRFILAYNPEYTNPSYAHLLVETTSDDAAVAVQQAAAAYMQEAMPDCTGVCKLFSKGAGLTAKIEARFYGPDPQELRRLANEAAKIMSETPGHSFVRVDWRNPVKVLRPQVSSERMRHLGLTLPQINRAMRMVGGGEPVGLYRDGNNLLPILVSVPRLQQFSMEALQNFPIWAPAAQSYVPLSSVVTALTPTWEDGIVTDRNRSLTVTAQSEVTAEQNAEDFLKAIRPRIEAIPLPTGYHLEWGGEHKTSSDAMNGVKQLLPISAVIMFAITVLLFNSLVQPVIIFLCLPLTLIGVTWGLLAANEPFSFLAFLGFLSLMGMLVKNSIVLLDEISLNFASGKDRYLTIVDSGVSRLRPVSMSALTTVLGMVPLAWDRLFAPMAVTIMAGLTVSTLLTLVIVPVLTALFYGVTSPKGKSS